MKIDNPSDYKEMHSGVLIAEHFHENENYFITRAAGMNDWLMTFTLAGEGYFHVNGQHHVVKNGDLTFLKPSVPHSYGTSKNNTWNFLWVHFSHSLIQTNLLPSENLVIHRFEQKSIRKRLQKAFHRIISDFREQGDLWHELCLGALHEIIMLYAKQKNSKLDPRIEEVLFILADRMNETLTIHQIATMVGLSVSRLQHLFKENTGETIVESLNRMRIKQASYLLTHTNLTASEAAYNVGFQNYNHFTRQFHRYLGLTPRKFCQQVRSKS